MSANVSTNSPFYPYEKVQTGFATMDGASEIPSLICRYLMDLPLPGYTPPDNNDFPRVRLMKRLWYDEENPLGQPVPTPQQKLSMLFDGDNPVLNTDLEKAAHPKGYRIFPLEYWMQAQLEAKASFKCYIGREIPIDDFTQEIGLIFDIYVNANLEGGMGVGGLSKVYAMEKDIIAALHGVNITGVGTVQYNRAAHADSGSRPYYDESGTNVGRRLQMSHRFSNSEGNPVDNYENGIF